MKTLMQRTKKTFGPCPHCGKKGVYRKDTHIYPVRIELSCRYCGAFVWFNPREWEGMEASLAAFAIVGKPTRGQFRANN